MTVRISTTVRSARSPWLAAGRAAVGTLGTLRQVIHALRGWPTPMGLTVNSAVTTFGPDDVPDDPVVLASADLLAAQLIEFRGAVVGG